MEFTTQKKTPRNSSADNDLLLQKYLAVRDDSHRICKPLEVDDYGIQTMPDVSPPKWHLAHTSWFFEVFLLSVYDKSYKPFHPQYDYLFNSYYVTHGKPYPRPSRGLLSRPTVTEIYQYREYVDNAMELLILNADGAARADIESRVILGLNHEQQHQELLFTDIKHIFSKNPLKPVYREPKLYKSGKQKHAPKLAWHDVMAGMVAIGHQGNGFAFDNEGPLHKAYSNDFSIASRLITNGDYLEFIHDNAYQTPELWLSDGWSAVNENKWYAPLYWEIQNNLWLQFTLEGLRPIDLDAPVCHVSFYEADAYARWAGKRLPTEVEWEVAARGIAVEGNLRDKNNLWPVVTENDVGLSQIFGDVWEWTSSPYTAYPGYRPAAGSIGEYNGKFMSNQMVLRGGSFATPQDHIRSTYRNFFYPDDRWQFSGIRLVDDL